MAENSILCPNCWVSINLDEIAKHRYNEELAKNEKRLKEEFAEQLKKKEEELAKKEEDIKKEMWVKALKAAEEKKETETKDLLNQLEEFKKKQDESQKNELELRKKTRELEDAAKAQELENLRKLDEERKKLEESLKTEQKKREEEILRKLQEDYTKQLAEKDKQAEILRKSLEDANRKALQWSQQIQWEILENELKNILLSNFPFDLIDDIATWKRWADVVQKVRNNVWHETWIIVWEAKNTKHWTESWVVKLKEDRLRVWASMSVIVSNDLPDWIKHFWLHKDIWVTDWQYVIPLTMALREQIITMDHLKKSLTWKDEKMEVIYNYLTSVEFRDKIQNIVESFQTMKDDLDREKRAMEKLWSAREKQLERVITNTSKLYWDMQWLIWSNLQRVEYLELDAPDLDKEDEV